jgi:hypothetical protein
MLCMGIKRRRTTMDFKNISNFDFISFRYFDRIPLSLEMTLANIVVKFYIYSICFVNKFSRTYISAKKFLDIVSQKANLD